MKQNSKMENRSRSLWGIATPWQGNLRDSIIDIPVMQTTLGSSNAYQIPADDQPDKYPKRLIIHTPHTVNLASEKNFGRGLLQACLNRCADILAFSPEMKIGAVFHPGRGKGTELDRIIEQIHSLTIPDGVTLYAENSAGQGHEHCRNLDELQEMFETLPKKIKLCIDTQHSFASGICEWSDYDCVSDFIQEIDRVLPYRLRLIHLNDSKKPFGSRVDRHENIFEGYIWQEEEKQEGLRSLLEISHHNKIPMILETPNPHENLEQLFKFWDNGSPG